MILTIFRRSLTCVDTYGQETSATTVRWILKRITALIEAA